VRDFYFTPRRFSALGARTACSLLEAAGHQVSHLNFPMLSRSGRSVSLPPELEHLRDLIAPLERGPLSFFTRYQHFGPSCAECADRVVATEPDLVLLSSFAFAYADQALELAGQIRQRRPGTTVVAGGAGASVLPEYYLDADSGGPSRVDLVLAGEAEAGLVDLVGRLTRGRSDLSGIPGLYRAGDGTSLPPPSRTESGDLQFVWSAALKTARRVHVSTSLSRGCPRTCRFCSNHLTHGRHFRTVPFERVAAGIEQLPQGLPIVLNFEDDNLLLAREYWLDILRLCRERLPGVTFRAENGLDYGLLDEAVIDELIDVGMERFDLTLGSAASDVLRSEQRHGDLHRLARVVRRAADREVPVVTYFICGLQGDTVETVLETLLLLAELPTQVGISMFYAVPGLPGFTDLGLFERGCSSRCAGSSAWPWTGSLTSAQLVTAFRLARFVNLSRKETLSAEEGELLERCRREGRLYTWQGRDRRCVPAPGIDGDMAAECLSALARR